MSEHFWLTEEQMERLRPFLPKSRGKPRFDDGRVRRQYGADTRRFASAAAVQE
jgi:hypothetical protein